MFSKNSYFSGKDKLFELRRERIEQEQRTEQENGERSTRTENGAREQRTEQQL